jgi:Tfp pilus assembly protein PilF
MPVFHLGLTALPAICLAFLLAAVPTGCSSRYADLPAFRAHPLVSDPQTSYQYGRYLQNKGKHQWAVQELAKAVDANPQHVRAYNAMGVSHDILGEYVQAEKCYQAALEIDPDQAWVHNNLGVSALMRGDVGNAISSFSRAVELSPDTVRFRNNLGLAYVHNNEMHRAFAQFSAAEGPSQAHARMATCFQQAGQSDLAKEHLALAYAQESGPESTELIHQTVGNGDHDLSSKTARGDQKHIYRNEVDTSRVVAASASTQTPPGRKGGKVKPGPEKEKKTQKRVVPVQAQAPALKSDSQRSGEECPIQEFTPDPQPGIEISNGNGIRGMAARVGRFLSEKGQHVVRLTNAQHFRHEHTLIFYGPEYLQQAYQVAQEIPGWQDMREDAHLGREEIKIRVRIGRDIVRYDGNQFGAL